VCHPTISPINLINFAEIRHIFIMETWRQVTEQTGISRAFDWDIPKYIQVSSVHTFEYIRNHSGLFFSGDGRESRHEYTMMICTADPDLYQISHYLYDDYDVNNDHHLEQTDYEGWHKKIDDSGMYNTEHCLSIAWFGMT
jgi:hypothetical protein